MPISKNLLLIAQRAVAKDNAKPDSLVAVVFGVMWLESYVNELLETLVFPDEDPTKLPKKLQALRVVAEEMEQRRAQLPEKIQVISAVLIGRPIDRGARPYQDFDLLLAVRNRLVHTKPIRLTLHLDEERSWSSDDPKKISRGLAERGFAGNNNPRGQLPWFYSVSIGPRFGRWALDVVDRMARAVADCFLRAREVPGDGAAGRTL
jgi:hypothetical protein